MMSALPLLLILLERTERVVGELNVLRRQIKSVAINNYWFFKKKTNSQKNNSRSRWEAAQYKTVVAPANLFGRKTVKRIGKARWKNAFCPENNFCVSDEWITSRKIFKNIRIQGISDFLATIKLDRDIWNKQRKSFYCSRILFQP